MPLLTLWLAVGFRGPSLRVLHFGDPDYGYLMNSLVLAEGHAPGYHDHPGTPVILLGTALLAIQHALAGLEPGFAFELLRHPERAQRFVAGAFLALFLLAQWLAGVRLLAGGIKLPGALLAQLVPLAFPATLFYLDHVSPETLLGAVGYALLPVLVRAGRGEAREWDPYVAGAWLGLACALKIVAAPLLAMAFVFERRRRASLLLVATAAFVLGTLPVLGAYPEMFRWFVSLLAHEGLYGTGAAGLPGPAHLSENLRVLLLDAKGTLPLLMLGLFALASFFARGTSGVRWPERVAVAVGLLLTLKHPADRYLLPLAPLASLALLRIRDARITAALLPLLLLAVVPSWTSFARIQAGMERSTEHVVERMREQLEGRFAACAVTIASPVAMAPFTLMSGDMAVGTHSVAARIEAEYPRYRTIFVGHQGDGYRDAWEAWRARFPCHVLIGNAFLAPSIVQDKLALPIEEVARFGSGGAAPLERETGVFYSIYRLAPTSRLAPAASRAH